MKQIQFLILASFAIFLTSCGSSTANEDLSKKLERYRTEQAEINSKIDELQGQLEVAQNGSANRTMIPVVIETLEQITFNHYFDASGAVVAAREAYISPEVNGQIQDIFVKEGDRVRKGQTLARLNTEVTNKSIDEIKTSLVLAKDIFERQKRLWEQKIGSELQFLEAKNNKTSLENRLATLQAQLDMATVTAPIDGVIEKVNQKKGELASPGAQMIHLVNLNELLVRADVSERFVSSVKRGDIVELTFPSFPDFKVNVPVSRIGNVVNKNNRTFEVELKIDNTREMLKPNMIAVLNINDFTAENSIVIPSKVIKEDLKGKYLYVAQKEGNDFVARKRYITPDRTYYDKTRVIAGLSEKEMLIVEGYNRVSDGALVKMN
jgi:membrane fusion protein (multidrug efflux system)